MLILAACVGYTRLRGSAITGTTSEPEGVAGRVDRVVDGDTFRLDDLETRIRIWGLDPPEVGSTEGSAATAALKRLILGERLSCRQRDIDRYSRIVGQCFLPDGRDIAAAMIATGTATEYCRYSAGYYGSC